MPGSETRSGWWLFLIQTPSSLQALSTPRTLGPGRWHGWRHRGTGGSAPLKGGPCRPGPPKEAAFGGSWYWKRTQTSGILGAECCQLITEAACKICSFRHSTCFLRTLEIHCCFLSFFFLILSPALPCRSLACVVPHQKWPQHKAELKEETATRFISTTFLHSMCMRYHDSTSSFNNNEINVLALIIMSFLLCHDIKMN